MNEIVAKNRGPLHYKDCILRCIDSHHKDQIFYNGDHWTHYGDVIMDTMASQITSLTIVYSTVYSGADERKHQSSASLAFVRGIHRGPVNSPHKWPFTRKMFPFDDVIMWQFVLIFYDHYGRARFCVIYCWDDCFTETSFFRCHSEYPIQWYVSYRWLSTRL